MRLVQGRDYGEEPDGAMDGLDALAHLLEEKGYANTGELDGPGTFALRGGTVDVFPGNLPWPLRIDFFGDEVEEIRRIVPSTGQTIASLSEVEIFPVREFAVTEAALRRAKKKLEALALSNPTLRDVREKLEGGRKATISA